METAKPQLDLLAAKKQETPPAAPRKRAAPQDYAQIDWLKNTDENGQPTFLLPGESNIDGKTMRARTAAYYRQTWREYSPAVQAQRATMRRIRAELQMLEGVKPLRPE